jgi:hypothetical protein
MSKELTIYFLYNRCVASLHSQSPFRVPINVLPNDEELFSQLRRCLGQKYNSQFFSTTIRPLTFDKVEFLQNSENEIVFSFPQLKNLQHHKNLTPDFLIMSEFRKIQEMTKDESISKVYLTIPSHFHQEKRIRLKLCCERIFGQKSTMIVNCPVALALGLNSLHQQNTISETQDLYIVLNENGIDINVVKITNNDKTVKQIFAVGTCKLSLNETYLEIANYIIHKFSFPTTESLRLLHSIRTSISDMSSGGNCEINLDNQRIVLSRKELKSICDPFFTRVKKFLQQHQSRIPRYNKVHFFGSGLLLPHFKDVIVASFAVSESKIATLEPNCLQLMMNGTNQPFTYIPCLPYSILKVDNIFNRKHLSLIFKTSTLYNSCQQHRLVCSPDTEGKIVIYEGLSDDIDKNAKMITLSSYKSNPIYEFSIDVNGILLIKDCNFNTFVPCFYHSDLHVAHYLEIIDQWNQYLYQPKESLKVRVPLEPERWYLVKGQKQINYDQILPNDFDQITIMALNDGNITFFPIRNFTKMEYHYHRVHLFENGETEPSLILMFDQAQSFFKHLSKKIDTNVHLDNYDTIQKLIENDVFIHTFLFTDKFKITISNGTDTFDLC